MLEAGVIMVVARNAALKTGPPHGGVYRPTDSSEVSGPLGARLS